ncbi:MAG: tRNA(Ile)-lysidine synthetase, partial [uncultured bacterium]
HNLNDQAETFLLQALRGAGPKGLSAMPISKKIGLGKLIRPLLQYSRSDILIYAKQYHLKWIEDESNLNNKFDRNFLRNIIFPKLLERKPAVFENFARSARLLAEHEAILSEIACEDFAKVKTDDIQKINLKKMILLSNPRQRLVLREWLSRNDIRSPSEKQLKQIQKDVLLSKSDAHPIFKLNHFCMKRTGEILSLVNNKVDIISQ